MATLQFIRQLSESRSLVCLISISNWTRETEHSAASRAPDTAQDLEMNTCHERRQPPASSSPSQNKVLWGTEKAESGSKAYTARAALFCYLWASYLPISQALVFPPRQTKQPRQVLELSQWQQTHEQHAQARASHSDWHHLQTTWLVQSKSGQPEWANWLCPRLPDTNSHAAQRAERCTSPVAQAAPFPWFLLSSYWAQARLRKLAQLCPQGTRAEIKTIYKWMIP